MKNKDKIKDLRLNPLCILNVCRTYISCRYQEYEEKSVHNLLCILNIYQIYCNSVIVIWQGTFKQILIACLIHF